MTLNIPNRGESTILTSWSILEPIRRPIPVGVGALVLVIAGMGPRDAWAQPPANPEAPMKFTSQPSPPQDPYKAARLRMVERHLKERGIRDERVLEAFRTVPRHRFLPRKSWPLAYEDTALPIGEGQTISSPSIVAYMTQALEPDPEDVVYEVGTGSGYQAAILSRLVKAVYSVEIHRSLGETAARTLKELGYDNVFTRVGDGYAGWPEAAPFDAVIVTCSPENIPPPLIEQLKEGGRMVIPLGDRYNQNVHIYTKRDGKLVGGPTLPTLFVPMTGRAAEEAKSRKVLTPSRPKGEGENPPAAPDEKKGSDKGGRG